MSGRNVAYQLRPNKHVERLLFVELLEKICQNQTSSYAYISMGGPQLDDHRLFYQTLGITKLFSFEEDAIVYKRQLFNQRPSCIKCLPIPIDEFVSEFDSFLENEAISDKKLIVWLDYASTKRREQLIEYQILLDKLQEQDVVKITLNANPKTLGEAQSKETQDSLFKRRLEKIRGEIGEYLSPDITSDDMTGLRLVPVLCHAVEVAAEKGTNARSRLKPLLLSLFVYQDGEHQMLTTTVRLTNNSDIDQYKANLNWEYLPSSWQDVTKINIPALSAKERLVIESQLPVVDYSALHDNLPFRLHTDENISLEMLKEYARHYKRYPSYFQVVL